MKPPLVVVGAGRHGRNVVQAALRSGREILGFLDDTHAAGARVDAIEVLGGLDLALDASLRERARFHVAVGRPADRLRIAARIRASGGSLANVIDPATAVSEHARLGDGIFLGAFVRVSSGARLDDLCLIESLTVLGCDSHLGTAATCGPHCTLVAGSQVGEGTFLGTGTRVLGVRIGRDCIVGAGSVVTRDLPDGVRAMGVPARVRGAADGSRPPV